MDDVYYELYKLLEEKSENMDHVYFDYLLDFGEFKEEMEIGVN